MNPETPEQLTNEERQFSQPEIPMQRRSCDGFDEIHWAAFALGYGLLIWLQSNSQRDAFWNSRFTDCVYFVLLVVVLPRWVEKLRKRVPRPQRQGIQAGSNVDGISGIPLAKMAAFILIASCLSFALNKLKAPSGVSDGVVGLMLTANYALSCDRFVGWKRLVAALLALVMVMIAALPALHPVSEQHHLSLMFLSCGLATLASGGITLWQYLQEPQ